MSFEWMWCYFGIEKKMECFGYVEFRDVRAGDLRIKEDACTVDVGSRFEVGSMNLKFASV